MTLTATCCAPDRMPDETTDEGLRWMVSETAPQTMSDTARRTRDHATVPIASQTVRKAIPRVGVPVQPDRNQVTAVEQLISTNRDLFHPTIL